MIKKIITGLNEIRKQKPLIINITNQVVMNHSANALLALGVSPAMSHFTEDVNALAQFCGALILNPGTPDDELIRTMISAGITANEYKKSVVLDPVASGATEYRTRKCKEILSQVYISIIRGNASEIMSLISSDIKGKGVDSCHSSDDALGYAKTLANEYKTIVCVTGEKDYVTNGKEVCEISGGDIIATFVTGMGCFLSAMCGAFLAVMDKPFDAGVSAMCIMKICTSMAMKKSKLPGSFAMHFIDALYEINDDDVIKNAIIIMK